MDKSVSGKIVAVTRQVETLLVGKKNQVKQSLACILAGGHLLLEDVPGVGKTTLSHALAVTLGLDYARVQFTSDLMPADVLGSSILDRNGEFKFQPGPIFNQVLLADEINRSTPKTQSAMLEAMEERQVTTDGVTRNLPKPFFVIATQNPLHQAGTFPLPESQLDRFLMCISIGYPDEEAELDILMGRDRRSMLKETSAVLGEDDLSEILTAVTNVHASEEVAKYVQRLAHVSRSNGIFVDGLSPRGALALLKASKAWATLEGRDFVLPDDVKAVAAPVLSHRLQLNRTSSVAKINKVKVLLDSVKV
jgi:MoxR-like ATPase